MACSSVKDRELLVRIGRKPTDHDTTSDSVKLDGRIIVSGSIPDSSGSAPSSLPAASRPCLTRKRLEMRFSQTKAGFRLARLSLEPNQKGIWNQTCFSATNKFPQSVMVWGAIARAFRSKLVLCSNSENSAEYTQILTKSDVILKANEVYGIGGWCLVQDGAACHHSKQSLDWLDEHKILVMPGWPPHSPDLNPIEMVWGMMMRSLIWDTSDKWTKEKMLTKLQQVWDDIAQESLERLSDSFIRRCQMVLDLDGESASSCHFLNCCDFCKFIARIT